MYVYLCRTRYSRDPVAIERACNYENKKHTDSAFLRRLQHGQLNDRQIPCRVVAHFVVGAHTKLKLFLVHVAVVSNNFLYIYSTTYTI